MKRNPALSKLKSNYLFPEINLRKKKLLKEQPGAHIISLGVGDTTEPLAENVARTLADVSTKLGTREGYSGYGAEQGEHTLRGKISEEIYHGLVTPDEIFISDGAKPDLGRLQMLFGSDVSIAVQDPAYPVYVEGSIIQGVKNIHYLPCSPENDFFPDLAKAEGCDLIYFCSPNNPTGATATREQLKELVAFAKANESIIIFDSAYAGYIQDDNLPKSIYEIEGADEVAIEVSSFSKLAGFTGVRLGWTVVPSALCYEDGSSVKADWNRLICTVFNGASNLVQRGGCAVLDTFGFEQSRSLISYYMENAKIIKGALETLGYDVYGGVNAPYLWVHFKGQNSWDVFQRILDRYHIVTTPGSGFGPSGDEFVRFTSFGRREKIVEAIDRLLAGKGIGS